MRRPVSLRRGVTRTFGERRCARCWREFQAVAENQRFCSPRCRWLARQRDEAKYARPAHRGTRKRLAPIVAQGWVRCARGAACRRAEFVDGALLGGFIEPGEAWHLGHPDGESVGGPEHVALQYRRPFAPPRASEARAMTHAKTVAMVWGSEPPAFSIGHEKPMWPGDSGFTVIFSDAPDPDEVHGPDDPRVTLVCLHCLINDHPEIGRGLDIAREYGAADLDDNDEWIVGDGASLD